MSNVRAFVGHSFLPADDQVVRAFTSFLDGLTDLHSSFSWEHAQSAAAVDLPAKVLEKTKNKNVFIGICTRKELVPKSELRKDGVLARLGLLRQADLEWKTSDWVIQEIGLAVGQGMKLILLIEEGVRKPGGLQGDVEYIAFKRGDVGASFPKIMQMINSVAPSTKATISFDSSQSAPQPETSEHKSNETSSARWENPEADWDRQNYEVAFAIATIRKKAETAKRINETYATTESGKQPENAASWAAFVEATRLSLGEGGDVAKLRALAKSHSDNDIVLRSFARAQEHFGNMHDAADLFQRAAEATSVADTKVEYLCDAALAVVATDPEKALNIADDIRTCGGDELVVLNALVEIYEKIEDNKALVPLLERLLEIDPTQDSKRFDLAYKCGNDGAIDLAIMHYNQLSESEKSIGGWNNLGVEYSKGKMPGKSISAYKAAKDKGETLAVSNLANAYIDSGFFTEARTELDEAVKTKDHHKNIDSALVRLNEAVEKENNLLEQALKTAGRKSEFQKNAGAAAAMTAVSIDGVWQNSEYSIRFVTSGRKVLGTIESGTPPNAATQSNGDTLTFAGVITGRLIYGVLAQSRTPAGVRLYESPQKEVVYYVDEQSNTIHAMQEPHKNSPDFYKLERRIAE